MVSRRDGQLAFGGAIAAAATVLAMSAGVARADLSNQALCHTSLAVTIDGPQFTAHSTELSCNGLLDSQPVAAGGALQMWGDDVLQPGAGGCSVSFSHAIFSANVPRALSLIDESDAVAEGELSIGAGPFGAISGPGDVDQTPYLTGGVATFAPSGPGCSTLTAGTLSLTLLLTDGGTGDPGVADQVEVHLGELPGPASTPAKRPHAKAGRSSRQRHRRHRAVRRQP